MLNEVKITKMRLLDMVWLVYLILMMSFAFTGSQQIYTGVLTLITIVHMILTKKTKFRLKQFSGLIWYFLFAIFVNLSRIWSVYDYNYTGITGWVIYISVAMFCLNYAFDNRKDNFRFWNLFVMSGAVFCIVALVTSPISTYTTDAFSGITGHYRTWIGELSAILIGINIYLYRYCDKKKKYLFFAVLGLLTVFATGARGAVLLVVIELLYFVAREKNLNKKLGYILLGTLGAIVVLFVVFRNSVLYHAFVERVIGAIVNDGSTNSVNERWYFIQIAFDLFKSHPLIGCGVDAVRGYLEAIGYWHVTYSHCLYVELLASYGILGTTIFLAPAIKRLFTRKKNKLSSFILPVLLLGFIWSVQYYSFIFIFLLDRLQFGKEEMMEK